MPKWLSITIILTSLGLHTACSAYQHVYHGDSYENTCQRTSSLQPPPGSTFTPKAAASSDANHHATLDSYTKPVLSK